jgi:nucleoside-diphosphate-sugar epimerase
VTSSARILVTGAAGFLGSHLCARLHADGCGERLVALDAGAGDGAARLAALAPAATIVSGDVADAATVARCMAGVDVVFHLAAIADPRVCEHDPARAQAVNVEGTRTVVGAAAGTRIVFLSSAVTYLPAGRVARDETAPVGAAGVYAATKLAGERLCLDAMAAGRLEAVVVRNFNTYGGGQADVFLVPQLVRQALREGRVQVASCAPVRDFTYVDDAVAALIALGLGPVAGGIYNLGSGHGTAVGDVALALGRLLDVPVSCAHAAVGGNPHLVAAPAKLRAATGWAPAIDVEAGLARTIAWFRARAADASSPD